MTSVRGCDLAKASPTDPQKRVLRMVEADLQHLFTSLQTTQPDVPAWRTVLDHWDRRLRLGTRHLVPVYVPDVAGTGCLSVGLDANGSIDMRWRIFGRCAAVLLRNLSRPCTEYIDKALTYAQTTLGFRIDLSCDDYREFGLIRKEWYTNARCDVTHDARRGTFEELVGRPVDDAIEMVRAAYPDLHVVVRHWDLLGESASYDLHAEKETLVIHIDPVSNKVVLPEPQLASLQTVSSATGHCFLLPDEGTCKGVPRVADGAWTPLIGQLITDAVDTLRFNYPHAVVEASPVTWRIPPVRRRDRIRVLFDPKTARVTHITIG